MKSFRLVVGAMLAWVLVPGIVLAQQSYAMPRISQPGSLQKTAFQEDPTLYGYAEAAPAPAPAASPSDAPPKPAAPPAAAAAPVAEGADCGGCGECCCDPCDPGFGCRLCRNGALADPWTLFPAYENGLKLGGWLSAGVFGNAYGARSNGPIGMRDVGDQFTSDQNWFFIDKPINTEEKDFDWGFRMDYVFGADGPDTQSFGNSPFGWDNGWVTSNDGVYGSAIPQLYGVAAWKKLSVKLGHFYTPIGYEVVQVTGNFFYSHSYCHTFGEPFTHTGGLATYQVNEKVAGYAGWTTAWDTGFENPTGASLFLGGFAVPVGEKMTLTWLCSGGNNGQVNGAGLGDLYMNSFVLNFAINDKWTYVFQHDLGLITGQPGANAQWYGINQYLFYKLNDCWSLGGRFEWFRDDDGTRVPGFQALGNRADYYALTCGLNWKPHANVNIRPELRYDWANGVFGAGNRPFNDGADREQFSGGFDFVITY